MLGLVYMNKVQDFQEPPHQQWTLVFDECDPWHVQSDFQNIFTSIPSSNLYITALERDFEVWLVQDDKWWLQNSVTEARLASPCPFHHIAFPMRLITWLFTCLKKMDFCLICLPSPCASLGWKSISPRNKFRLRRPLEKSRRNIAQSYGFGERMCEKALQTDMQITTITQNNTHTHTHTHTHRSNSKMFLSHWRVAW